MKIILTDKEVKFLMEDQKIANILTDKIYKDMDKFYLDISEDAADNMRDYLGELLQIYGFNETYELTLKGEILENLIDKFFVG